MHQLLGERFVPAGEGWIDLASGAPVRLRLAAAGDRAAQIAWNDECAGLAQLRHSVLNPLVDFGFADRERIFEAYALNGPLRTSAPGAAVVLTHGMRFLEANGVSLTAARAPFLVRDVLEGPSPKRRPLGIVLQVRAVHAVLVEVLGDSASGMLTLDVVGGEGSGLRTLRMAAARAARLDGYIPVDGHVVLRMPWLRNVLTERHLCVFVDDRYSCVERTAIASFLSSLATHSTRRHVVLRLARSERRDPHALEMDPMAVSALTRMVFIDRDCGPAKEELLRAARDADGRPGAFLSRLRAANCCEHAVRIAMVRESPVAYAYAARSKVTSQRRRLHRALLEAPSRAARLATRGRHASARRLLARAARVLEGRHEAILAASCTERLAWLDRNRGHVEAALEGFTRAKALAGDSIAGVAAAVGTGVAWTDLKRFAEAEAALRGACAAARIVDSAEIHARASVALARCLFCQTRHDEAAAVLSPLVATPPREANGAEACALHARNEAARGELRTAVSAAVAAAECAERLDDSRLRAIAARAMVVVQGALGDYVQVRVWVERGLRAAASAHLPLAVLRFRALAVRMGACERRSGGASQSNHVHRLRRTLDRCKLPTLLRAEIEEILDSGIASGDAALNVRPEDRSLNELQHLLEVVQRGEDDQTALSELCRTLAERLRAATVQVVAGAPEPRTLARAGKPWQGEAQAIARILAGGAALSCDMSPTPHVAVHPIRYGQEPIAVLCCRWTAGLAAEPRRATELLHAGALAAAAPVRSVLDRSPAVVPTGACGELIGTSPAAVQLRDAIVRAARAPFPVLLEGESGSGKELVARGIHRLSVRRDRRLCTVNCAALADDLLEAELFGHARGAFTGAIGERAGLFEEADGGTLFLDEVGELSARAQAKLLRVLQDGEVRRVGENLPRRVDARIVAATNRRLVDEVAANRFRADLRFRLDVIRIAVPPLRERATDIPALAGHFWKEATSRLGSSATLTAETLAALARYDWPGNVRELQNAIASLAVHAPRRGRVGPSLLPDHVARSAGPGAATFDAARQEFERRYVRAALAQAGGHRVRAARSLGVSRQGLAKMMRRLQIGGEGT